MSYLKQHKSGRCEAGYSDSSDRIPLSAPAFFEDYDWRCAFVPAVEMGFRYRDIDEVIASDGGEKDERDWIALFRTKTHEFILIESGCDYTGWDCQSSGVATLYRSLAQAIDDMGDAQKDRLGLPLVSNEKPVQPTGSYAWRRSE